MSVNRPCRPSLLVPALLVPPLLVLASLLLLAQGCSDDGASSDKQDGAVADARGDGTASPDAARDTVGDAGDELPASDYCEQAVDVFCPYYVRCKRMAVADVATCRKVFLETCNGRYEPVYAALAAAGELRLSASGLARCKAHLASVDCAAQIFDLDGGCDAMWVGRAAVGDPCGTGIQGLICAPGGACVLDLSFCGSCKAVAAPGQACGSAAGTTCVASEFCDSTTKRCVARKAVGQSCGADDRCMLGASCKGGSCAGPTIVSVGDNCDQANRCPYLSSCIGGVCTQSALLGQSCGAQAACAAGRCEQGSCVALRAAGESCLGGAECLSGSCSPSAGCGELLGACLTP
jgi:hypothetical protein